MKTRIIYLCLLVIFSTTGCIPTQTIKGDDNITTENIPVSEYDCLELEGGGMVVNYTQSDAPEGLEIKTDRNIFEKYEFNVENHKLKIRPKKEFRKHTNFRPTEFMVTANSRNLKKLAAAGSTHVNINSPLQAEEFEAGLAGSGDIEASVVNKIKAEIAGSGSVKYKGDPQDIQKKVMGSGKIEKVE